MHHSPGTHQMIRFSCPRRRSITIPRHIRWYVLPMLKDNSSHPGTHQIIRSSCPKIRCITVPGHIRWYVHHVPKDDASEFRHTSDDTFFISLNTMHQSPGMIRFSCPRRRFITVSGHIRWYVLPRNKSLLSDIPQSVWCMDKRSWGWSVRHIQIFNLWNNDSLSLRIGAAFFLYCKWQKLYQLH